MGYAQCKGGRWQTQMNDINNEWKLVNNKLEGKPCKVEGQMVSNLKWKWAWSVVDYQGVTCYYAFSELYNLFTDYDFAANTGTYKIDSRNKNWHFDYNWRWNCSKSIEECSLSKTNTLNR